MSSVCSDEGMPDRVTVWRWIQGDPEFATKYAHAREMQAELYADEIVTIADSEDDPQKARNRIGARQWFASKLRPRVYGDKIEHTGKDGAPLNGATLDAGGVIDGLVALATEHPIAAHPLRKLLQSALERIPVPE